MHYVVFWYIVIFNQLYPQMGAYLFYYYDENDGENKKYCFSSVSSLYCLGSSGLMMMVDGVGDIQR